jgi:hypothetical protein
MSFPANLAVLFFSRMSGDAFLLWGWRNTVAPPEAKFGTSSTIFFHSGVTAICCNCSALSNQSSVMR